MTTESTLSKGTSGCLATAGCPVSVFIGIPSQLWPAQMYAKNSDKRNFFALLKSENWASNSPVCKYLSHLQALLNIILAQEIFLLCVPEQVNSESGDTWVTFSPNLLQGCRGGAPPWSQLTGWRRLPKMPRAAYACSQGGTVGTSQCQWLTQVLGAWSFSCRYY